MYYKEHLNENKLIKSCFLEWSLHSIAYSYQLLDSQQT